MITLSRPLSAESVRSALLALALIAAFDAYHIVLKMYLIDLDRPLVMEFAFMSSAIIACLYEFKSGERKVGLAGSLATLFLFVVGALLACWLRTYYIEFVAAIKAAPDFADVVGHDVYHALTARLVGYSGCFAIGMLVARITLAKAFRRIAVSFFAPVTQNPCPTCHGSGHVVP